MLDFRARFEQLTAGVLVIDTNAPTCCPGAFPLEALTEIAQADTQSTGSDLMLVLEDRITDALTTNTLPEFWSSIAEARVDAFSATVGVFGSTPFTYENAIRDLARWNRRFREVTRLRLLRCGTDLDDLADHPGDLGILLHFANTLAIGSELERFGQFADLGVHLMQLTYNSANQFGDGYTERRDGGLTNLGRSAIKAMNDVGVMVDLAHAGDRTTLEALELSRLPCAVTHSACRAVAAFARNTSDEVLECIGSTGGYFGMSVTPYVLVDEGRPDMDDWLRHFEHAIELVGLDGVGIGTDAGVKYPPGIALRMNAEMSKAGFRPAHTPDWSAQLAGFNGWADWAALASVLLGRGFSEPEVQGFLGENFRRTFAAVSP